MLRSGGREGGGISQFAILIFSGLVWSGPDDKLHLITSEICPIIYTIGPITTDTNIILQHICNSLLSNQTILGKYHNTA